MQCYVRKGKHIGLYFLSSKFSLNSSSNNYDQAKLTRSQLNQKRKQKKDKRDTERK